jgi:hypothetical protein
MEESNVQVCHAISSHLTIGHSMLLYRLLKKAYKAVAVSNVCFAIRPCNIFCRLAPDDWSFFYSYTHMCLMGH